MAFTAAYNTVFYLDNSSDSLTDVSAYVNNSSLQQIADLLETSMFGNAAKTFIGGQTSATISISGGFDVTFDAIANAAVGTAKTFNLYPNGEPVGASKPKYSGECLLTGYTISGSVGGLAEWSCDFTVTGAITRAVA